MMGRGSHFIASVAASLGLAVLLAGCSPKRNTYASRQYQAFITRYNIYYNGDEHYRNTLERMEKEYRDDYNALLPLHPAEAEGREPSSAFDRSIEKAQKAIRLRSITRRPRRRSQGASDPEYKAWLRREEYNPFMHNAWMLLGRSRFYNSDFNAAAATFRYITRHYTWLPSTVAEARAWQARSYAAMGWTNEAATLLARVDTTLLSDKNVAAAYYPAMADVCMRQGDYTRAAQALRRAIRYTSGAQKTRLRFLLAQLLTRTGDRTGAYKTYSEIVSTTGAPYETKLTARLYRSEVTPADKSPKEIAALRRLTRYERNSEYQARIRNSIGRMLLASGDTAAAITELKAGADHEESTSADRAPAQLALAEIYLARKRYDLAQPYYSAASGALPSSYPGIDSIRRRSEVLEELALYAGTIHLQDSLLELAGMSESDRMAAIGRQIQRHKDDIHRQREQDRQALADAVADATRRAMQQQDEDATNAPSTFKLNTDNSWYFYNKDAIKAGQTAFRRKWGVRKLEDNWRRSNKRTYTPDESPEQNITTLDDRSVTTLDTVSSSNDPLNPQYYLANIPLTPQAQSKAREAIAQSLFNMGGVLKDRLEDYAAAESAYETLNSRFPDNPYRLDVLQALLLMHLRQGHRDRAERIREAIVSQFPDSPQGVAMASPGYIDGMLDMARRQEQLYAETYSRYLSGNNRSVHESYDEMSRLNPSDRIMANFTFLDGLAYLSEDSVARFNERMEALVSRWPDSAPAPLASSWLQQASDGSQVAGGGSNARSLIRDTRLAVTDGTSDTGSADAQASGLPSVGEFTFVADSPHTVAVMFDADSISRNALLYEIARHNFTTYSTADFDLEPLLFGRLAIILIHGLGSNAAAMRYVADWPQDAAIMQPGVTVIAVSEDDMRTLLRRGLTLADYLEALERLEDDDIERPLLDEE